MWLQAPPFFWVYTHSPCPSVPPTARDTPKPLLWLMYWGLSPSPCCRDSKMLVFFLFALLLGAALQLTNAYGDTFLHDLSKTVAPASLAAATPELRLAHKYSCFIAHPLTRPQCAARPIVPCIVISIFSDSRPSFFLDYSLLSRALALCRLRVQHDTLGAFAWLVCLWQLGIGIVMIFSPASSMAWLRSLFNISALCS
jgi:hypothetical protein